MRQRTNARDRGASHRREQETWQHEKWRPMSAVPVDDRRVIQIVFWIWEKGGRDVSATPKSVNLFSSMFFSEFKEFS
jgi:hypothetical protein